MSAKQEEEQLAKTEALKVKEIKTKFGFDIGPYGDAKAIKIRQGLTERDVRALFDEYQPTNKKVLDNGNIVWLYKIPDTQHGFFILFKKDSNDENRVNDFTIDLVKKKLDEVVFN